MVECHRPIFRLLLRRDKVHSYRSPKLFTVRCITGCLLAGKTVTWQYTSNNCYVIGWKAQSSLLSAALPAAYWLERLWRDSTRAITAIWLAVKLVTLWLSRIADSWLVAHVSASHVHLRWRIWVGIVCGSLAWQYLQLMSHVPQSCVRMTHLCCTE